MRVTVEGNHVHRAVFEFMTGDAAGQNMVTIAAEAVCSYIAEHSPVRPQYWFVEANMSGDKKATTQFVHAACAEEGQRRVHRPGRAGRSGACTRRCTRCRLRAHVGRWAA